MASDPNLEVMEHDGDDGEDDTFQVQVPNELFGAKEEGGNASGDEEVLDFEEADDLEITDFATKTDPSLPKPDVVDSSGLAETITISVMEPEDDDNKEDGELSEHHSHTDQSDAEGGDHKSQYLSRSSSTRSSKRRTDIRRERSPVTRRYPNPYLEMDDAKIQSRALRFGMGNAPGAENANVGETTKLKDPDLVSLYLSLGLLLDDGGKLTVEKVDSHHRLDSVLIRGTNHMNTNEIFKYLYDMGQKPLTMEWVNDANCVVIFSDKYDAAMSILKTSKPIMKDPRSRSIERKRSIASIDNDRANSEEKEKTESMAEDFDYDKVEVVPQRCITVPMPPGHVWRLGAPCEKAKGILVRYANKQDKKQEMAERYSEYYKNYGNPNRYGNPREYSGKERSGGRKKMRSEYLDAERDEELTSGVPQLSMLNANDKNGWGQLSAMWDDEEAFQRSARDRLTVVRQSSTKELDSSTLGVSPMKKAETAKESPAKPLDARQFLQTRQKRKRGSNSSDEDNNSDSDDGDNNVNVHDWKDNGSFRRKRRGSRVEDDDGEMSWKERLPGPRMRMHADEEEERLKRRAHRRLGHKRGGEGGFQTNSWEFSRESSHNSSGSGRYKSSSQRRPISERLGAKRNPPANLNNNDDVGFEDKERSQSDGFDLRQRLVDMRRLRGEGEEPDDNDDVFALIHGHPNLDIEEVE